MRVLTRKLYPNAKYLALSSSIPNTRTNLPRFTGKGARDVLNTARAKRFFGSERRRQGPLDVEINSSFFVTVLGILGIDRPLSCSLHLVSCRGERRHSK